MSFYSGGDDNNCRDKSASKGMKRKLPGNGIPREKRGRLAFPGGQRASVVSSNGGKESMSDFETVSQKEET